MKQNKDSYTPLIIFFITVVVLWVSSWLILDGKANRGTFGDMFGAVNALFSGLAFAGVIFTILLQKKELGLQRQELSATRQEFVAQNDTLRKQRFENTFFHLLNLHHEIIDHLSQHMQQHHLEKRDVFRRACIDLKGALVFSRQRSGKPDIYNDTNSETIIVDNLEDEEKYIIIAYKAFYNEYHNSFSHYFRNLYHIFKYIFSSTEISDNEKKFYAAIIRAQLSPDELFLIFYNSLIEYLGYPNFLFLIKEFEILENFDSSDIPFNNMGVFDEKIKAVHNPFNNASS